MSRRRYISTDISTDTKLADLSEKGILPLLLYTWSIPHMDDWGRMQGDARQFKLLVCPALDITTKEVDTALTDIHSVGLWERYEVEGKLYLCIHKDNWFKHQSYINKAKRDDDTGSNIPSNEEHRKTPQIAEEQQETTTNSEDSQESPKNTVSFSLSSSPSSSPSPSKTLQYADTVFLTEKQYQKLCDDFGKGKTDFMIEKLDLWQTNNPKKAHKDHNKSIRVWMKREINDSTPSISQTGTSIHKGGGKSGKHNANDSKQSGFDYEEWESLIVGSSKKG